MERNRQAVTSACDPAQGTSEFTCDSESLTNIGSRTYKPTSKCTSEGVEIFGKGETVKLESNIYPGQNELDCLICGEEFNTQDLVKIHLIDKHSIKHYECDICGKLLTSKQEAEWHSFNHQNDQYTCNICDKSFKMQATMEKHVEKTHTSIKLSSNEKKPFSCELCGKHFATKSLVKIHLRVHSKDKPFNCNLCDAVFGYTSSLKFHIKSVHANEKPFECGFCTKCFSSKTLLKIHMRVHTGIKEYSCEICSKSFGYLSSRNFHLRTVHGKEKSYECSTCGKCFSTQTLVKVHARVHTKEKPYSCRYCNKPFGYSSSLNTHEKTCDIDTQGSMCGSPSIGEKEASNSYESTATRFSDCDYPSCEGKEPLKTFESNEFQTYVN